MQRIRSLLFDVCFYLATLATVIVMLPLLLGPQRWAALPPRFWAIMTDFLARHLLRLSYRVEGMESLPPRPFLIACKHQSAWETLVLSKIFPGCVFVLKRELMWIPVLNLYFWRQRSISVNRKAGIQALKDMVRQARPIVADQQPIIIFPEGTRVNLGQKGEYQAGVAALYQNLDIPVVPVALNSGMFWGRRHFFKKSGTITVAILPAIQPGLNRKEFMVKLEASIEQKTDELCKQGVHHA
jgi:1-acyl-sn-glycerol-3-phosphate acyltransferase